MSTTISKPFSMGQFANHLLAGQRPTVKNYKSDQGTFDMLDSEQMDRINRSWKQPEVDQDDLDAVLRARSNDERDRAAAIIGLMIAAAYIEHRNEQLDQLEGDRWDGLS